MYIREEWIKKTEFHPVASAKVLEQVIARVKEVIADQKLPVVVFDLDSTLFNVSNRSFQILKDWLAHPESEAYSETVAALKNIESHEMRYSLQDVWEGRKIPHAKEPYETHFKNAKNFWRKRFFNNEYLVHDEPTQGAVAFVQHLYQLGAQIVYLTGRDIPLMGFGTFDQLKAYGLPIEQPRTRLILKPKRQMDDLVFKGEAAKTIMEWGVVVASFENEPKNLVAMQSAFAPETMNIFIQTVSSDHPAPAGKNIYKIDHFRAEN